MNVHACPSFTDDYFLYILEIFCLEAPIPVNGEVLSSQDMSVGTMTTYYCVSGYVLVGQVTRTCEDARGETIGIWSGTTPICEGTNNKQKVHEQFEYCKQTP